MKIHLLIFLFCFQVYARTWIDNSPEKTLVSYIYAPGTFSCECRMAIYMPKFVSSTCEEISCTDGIEVLKHPATACNFSEVALKRFNFVPHKPIKSIKKLLKRITYKISGYCNETHRISIKPCEGKKTSLSSQLTDLTKINFGQEIDISIFEHNYQKHLLNLERDYDHNVILYGFSRGAATIFNFVATRKPKAVKALICEGMFDSISNILSSRFKHTYKFMLNTLEKFTYFKIDGTSPIANVKEIPVDLPILLVTSESDYIVPHTNVLNIYHELRKLGHDKVHILILKHPGHLKYVFHNEQDRRVYEHTVHAFYKKYGLPYIEELAHKGEEYFAKTQLETSPRSY